MADVMDENERWQVREARAILALWDSTNGPDIYGVERALADRLRGMLAIIDRLNALDSC
jgi:hypothetical protein